jgi:hypothetical protein
VARQYLELSGAKITGVEIDPLVVELGRKYFGVEESDRLDVVVADGRTYLSLHDEKFDIILMDAFNPPTIPFHLATREFFELIRERLRPGGMVAVNVPRYGEKVHVVDPVCATMESVFGQVLLVDRRPDIPQLALASRSKIDLEEFRDVVGQNLPGTRQSIASLVEERTEVFDGSRRVILTDNRSPIEILVHNIIFDYARSPPDTPELG